VLAAAAVTASLACHPQAGLGTLSLRRAGLVRIVDLASCRVRSARVPKQQPHPLVSPDGHWRATVRVRGSGERRTNTIRVTNVPTGESHAALSLPAEGDTRNLRSPGPLRLLGWSGDDRWIFFVVDPGGSGSIAADGLLLQVVAATGGMRHELGVMLPNADYLAWCGGRIVFSEGKDRIAAHGKRLLVAAPPAWRPVRLVEAPGLSWGSLACRPGGRSLLVQSQRSSTTANFFATHWALWQVGLDGSRRQLTHPPSGSADESPRFSADGRTLLYVRSRRGHGVLRFRRGSVDEPLLALGFDAGYYGYRDWWRSMAWSLAARR
jgi:hypothetical protein